MAKLFKKEDEFIDLCRGCEEMATAQPSKTDKPEPRGPTFYVSDMALPVSEDDVDKTMTATIKIKPRRVSVTKENGKVRRSYDFEIKGIKFS